MTSLSKCGVSCLGASACTAWLWALSCDSCLVLCLLETMSDVLLSKCEQSWRTLNNIIMEAFLGDPRPCMHSKDHAISTAEVQAVVKQLKNRKAAGPDGLTADRIAEARQLRGTGAECQNLTISICSS